MEKEYRVRKDIETLEIKTKLSGQMIREHASVSIHAGAGGMNRVIGRNVGKNVFKRAETKDFNSAVDILER